MTRYLLAIVAICCASPDLFGQDRPESQVEPPNILWLSTEDIGPHLGCYGDQIAKTPNLDALAERGMVYDVAWSNYPVCAPARTTIITGLYASSLAAGHMRCSIPLDKDLKMFPQYLREAGYYCSNKQKEDYNIQKPAKVWDQSNGKAHYRNRETGQPFFAVFNHTGTHESKIRKRPHDLKTNPDTIDVPPYHPDTREVRQDWAQYYDNIATMDNWVGNELNKLERAGLSENTIVVFFGDHGSGMPRHKRYAGHSGMQVPLIVYVPEKLRHLAPGDYLPGGHSKRPVGFVDFAPTMLSLAGLEPPAAMQGNAFMGIHQTDAPEFVYGYRSRMDERIDCSRSLSNGRYVYIRNYMPHLPHGQFINYQQQTPTTSVWNRMYDEGKLNDVQAYFWGPKVSEELYDLEKDPHETKNLAANLDESQATGALTLLQMFRKAHSDSLMKFGDIELMPEPLTASLDANKSAFDLAQNDENMQLLIDAAQIASRPKEGDLEKVFGLMGPDQHPARRHWGSLGLLIRGKTAVSSDRQALRDLLTDKQATVRINAAEALATFGDANDLESALKVLLAAADMNRSDFYSAIWALNSIDRLGKKAAPILADIANLPKKHPDMSRGGDYVERLIVDLTKDQN